MLTVLCFFFFFAGARESACNGGTLLCIHLPGCHGFVELHDAHGLASNGPYLTTPHPTNQPASPCNSPLLTHMSVVRKATQSKLHYNLRCNASLDCLGFGGLGWIWSIARSQHKLDDKEEAVSINGINESI